MRSQVEGNNIQREAGIQVFNNLSIFFKIQPSFMYIFEAFLENNGINLSYGYPFCIYPLLSL